jgi:hypothetical protein
VSAVISSAAGGVRRLWAPAADPAEPPPPPPSAAERLAAWAGTARRLRPHDLVPGRQAVDIGAAFVLGLACGAGLLWARGRLRQVGIEPSVSILESVHID